MAMLEPGLSETVCATLLAAMKDAMDEVVRRGVDRTCARDFLIGHMNILAAVTFEEVQGVFSDACNKAIENGKPRIFRDDWLGGLRARRDRREHPADHLIAGQPRPTTSTQGGLT